MYGGGSYVIEGILVARSLKCGLDAINPDAWT